LGRALEGQQSQSVQEVRRPGTGHPAKVRGKFLARGGKFKILEGPEKFHRFIVIEFPNFEKAVSCHESPEYLEAAAHRKKDGAGELEIVIVESV
jgi:uncharacterized protein (DUF1330 family)